MAYVDTGDLDTRIRFERRQAGDAMDDAGTTGWEPVATVWASVVDVMPSRAEKLDEGLTISRRPARVRVAWRRGLSADMRIAVGALGQPDQPRPEDRRYLRIVSGPATLGNREWLEMMAEDQSSEGDG